MVGRSGDTISWKEAEGDHGEGGHDLFDLVVAADVVYLKDLWDAMAFTIKVRVNPKVIQRLMYNGGVFANRSGMREIKA